MAYKLCPAGCDEKINWTDQVRPYGTRSEGLNSATEAGPERWCSGQDRQAQSLEESDSEQEEDSRWYWDGRTVTWSQGTFLVVHSGEKACISAAEVLWS